MKFIMKMRAANRKKFRQGEEYGSAVWGEQKDIEPYMDLKDKDNNVILTQTECLTMGKPSSPKYARNKNILVIGGSGSGKTRFFVKPNLMQINMIRSGTPAVPGETNFQQIPPFTLTVSTSFRSISHSRINAGLLIHLPALTEYRNAGRDRTTVIDEVVHNDIKVILRREGVVILHISCKVCIPILLMQVIFHHPAIEAAGSFSAVCHHSNIPFCHRPSMPASLKSLILWCFSALVAVWGGQILTFYI